MMMRIRVIVSRFLDLLLGRRRDARLDEEIQAHLDLLTDQYIARGMPEADARVAARRAFGHPQQVKEAYREQRGLPILETLVQDVRFAARLLRRDPRFALTVVLVLGLGIGINNMLFTVLNAHTLRGLPMYRPDRVVFISTFDDRVPDAGVSYADFTDLERDAHSFTGMAAFSNAPMVIAADGHTPERLVGAYVSQTTFGLIGAQPVIGRDFVPADDRPGAAAVALLGMSTWRSRYGSDRALLGHPIFINGSPATIVGIVPERSGFPGSAELWLPLHQMPAFVAEQRGARTLSVFARLRDTVTVAGARTEVEGIAGRIAQERPETNRNVRARLVAINERFLGRLSDPAWLAFMTVGIIVVLISCANVANLMLSRTFHRAREIAIRSSLGAGRRRVVRQLVVEGAVLATLGGVVGLGVALAGVRIFRSAIPADVLPYWFDYSVDIRVLAALIAVSACTVFVFALLPAIHASKTDVNRVLKDGGRSVVSGKPARWSTVFLAAEFGLAVVLLAHFAAALRSKGPDSPSDIALHTDHLLTAAITLPADTYRAAAGRRQFYGRLNERLSALPGIESVTVTAALPRSGAEERRLDIMGRGPQEAGAEWSVSTVTIGARYFATLGLPLRRGREFATQDGTAGSAYAIVNERFAERFFADTDPIGQRVAVTRREAGPTPPQWLTVIGIAPSIRQRPRGDPDPVVYLPHESAPEANVALIVRGSGNAAALTPLLRQEVQAIDPNLPLYRVRTMDRVIRDAEWNGRVANGLFQVLTFIAVALCTLGLYAVTAHSVSQRAREIGIRMALGARAPQVVLLLIKRVLVQLAIGFGSGVVCTKVWDWIFPAGADDIKTTDPQTLLIVAAILAVVSTLASVVPAHRAVRLDPVAAIRHE